MTDNELIARVAELAGWVKNGEWIACPNGVTWTYCVIARTHGTALTADGLRILLDELLRAGWSPRFVDGHGYGYELYPKLRPTIYTERDDTLERATLLAYVAMKEQAHGI